MNYQTDIALKKTIEGYCKVRDDVIADYVMAKKIHDKISTSVRAIGLFGAPTDSDPRCSPEDFTKELDRSLWRHLFSNTGLPRYMDDEARKEFECGLERNPPPFEEGSVRSTLLSTAAVADEMFARGIYNLFRIRSGGHQTNLREPFKIPNKVIWAGMLDPHWAKSFNELKLSHHRRNQINDLDRVFRTLAGETYTPYNLEGQIGEAFKRKEDYEDDLFRVRGHKNGTLHVWIKRQDILDQANKIIAKYIGEALPDGRKASH